MTADDYRKRILDALDDLGAAQVIVEDRKKHAKLSFRLDGRGYQYHIARSSSDRRAHKRAIGDIRRMIRQSNEKSN